MDAMEKVTSELESLCSTGGGGGAGRLRVEPQSFEKDDDTNGHIDFITAASVSTREGGFQSQVPLADPVTQTFDDKSFLGNCVSICWLSNPTLHQAATFISCFLDLCLQDLQPQWLVAC
jgi:hypothetical protein